MTYHIDCSFDDDRGVWVATAEEFGFLEAEGETERQAVTRLQRSMRVALGSS